MARQTKIVITDDYTGQAVADGDAHEVELSLNGKTYRMDLATASLEKLEKAVEPFVVNAQRVRKVSSNRSNKRHAPGDTKKMRTWARENGYKIAEKGRIPVEIQDAYREAN